MLWGGRILEKQMYIALIDMLDGLIFFRRRELAIIDNGFVLSTTRFPLSVIIRASLQRFSNRPAFCSYT